VCAVVGNALVILIVEDNPFVGAALIRYLELMGHRPTWERSGSSASCRLSRGDRFDAVLADITMPGMSGLEFSERALKIDEGLAGRIIAMTGGADRRTLAGFEKLGIDVFTKPFDRGLLQQALERIAPRRAP
jgi:two-component system chemotaxis sensor kinase CheA